MRRERERERERDRQTDRQTDRERDRDRETETEREREKSNSNSKTLFYKNCSLGSIKNLTTIVLAKLQMSKYKITGIIYIHIGMNE